MRTVARPPQTSPDTAGGSRAGRQRITGNRKLECAAITARGIRLGEASPALDEGDRIEDYLPRTHDMAVGSAGLHPEGARMIPDGPNGPYQGVGNSLYA